MDMRLWAWQYNLPGYQWGRPRLTTRGRCTITTLRPSGTGAWPLRGCRHHWSLLTWSMTGGRGEAATTATTDSRATALWRAQLGVGEGGRVGHHKVILTIQEANTTEWILIKVEASQTAETSLRKMKNKPGLWNFNWDNLIINHIHKLQNQQYNLIWSIFKEVRV